MYNKLVSLCYHFVNYLHFFHIIIFCLRLTFHFWPTRNLYQVYCGTCYLKNASEDHLYITAIVIDPETIAERVFRNVKEIYFWFVSSSSSSQQSKTVRHIFYYYTYITPHAIRRLIDHQSIRETCLLSFCFHFSDNFHARIL